MPWGWFGEEVANAVKKVSLGDAGGDVA